LEAVASAPEVLCKLCPIIFSIIQFLESLFSELLFTRLNALPCEERHTPPPPPLAPLAIEYKPQRRKETLDEAFEREFGKDTINKIIINDQPQKSEIVAYCPAPPKITRTVYEELATYPEELQASLLKIYRGQYLTMRELEPLRLYFKIPKTNTKTRKKWSIATLLAELKKKYREIYG
jgi:hypothetical protein